jgi:hypothetical protein
MSYRDKGPVEDDLLWTLRKTCWVLLSKTGRLGPYIWQAQGGNGQMVTTQNSNVYL